MEWKDNNQCKRQTNLDSLEARFGLRVRKIRLTKDISQEELAFRSGLNRNYVSDVERGTRNVSLKAIEKFSKGLEVEVSELFIDEKRAIRR